MWPIIGGLFSQERGRSVALVVGVFAAVLSAVLLTGSVLTSKLSIEKTVQHQFRGTFDLLVRPPGVRTSLEEREQLVRPDYLEGIFGGITVRQWHLIQQVDGVSVAAPVEYLGYILPGVDERLRLLSAVPHPKPGALYQVRLDWVTHHGLQTFRAQDLNVLITDRPGACGKVFFVPPAQLPGSFPLAPRQLICYALRGDRAVLFIDGVRIGAMPRGRAYLPITESMPFLIAAVDPDSEDRLVGLRRTVLSGRPLSAHQTFRATRFGSVVPVIVSARSYLDEHLKVATSKVDLPKAPAPSRLLRGKRGWSGPPNPGPNTAYRAVRRLPTTPLATSRVQAAAFYRQVLDQLRHSRHSRGAVIGQYLTASQVRFRSNPAGTLRPVPVANDPSIYQATVQFADTAPPVENRAAQFRTLQTHDVVLNSLGTGYGVIDLQGTFDARRLRQYRTLARIPLDGYYPPRAIPADPATARLLHRAAYGPTRNIGGLIGQPPLMLTTLKAARGLTAARFFQDADPRAPISVIRVRLSGERTLNATSEARIRAVAAQIVRRTGLDVDVMIGSSPSPQVLSVPAAAAVGHRLLLREGWSKKGVALTVLSAIDAKSLGLSLVVLLTGGLYLLATSTAAIRTRRGQLALLSALGWPRHAIFGVLELWLALVGAGAGAAAAVLAYATATLTGMDLPWWHAVLAVPAGMVLACVAAAWPARAVTRLSPVQGMAPTSPTRTRTHARGVARLGVSNVRRAPARNILAGLSLALGVAAASVVVSLSAGFRSTVNGSLLGAAVTQQARDPDYAAALVVIGLGVVSIADVVYLGILDRRHELAVLRATGWPEAALRQMLLAEGLTVATTGSLTGGIAGGIVTRLAFHTPTTADLIASAATAALGLLICTAAILIPITHTQRFTGITTLATE